MSPEADRVLDENGDVILILRHPNPPFAVWSTDGDVQKSISCWLEPEDSLVRKFSKHDPAGASPTIVPGVFESVSVEFPADEPIPFGEPAPFDVNPDENPVTSDESAIVEISMEERADEISQSNIVTVEDTFDPNFTGETYEVRFRVSSKHLVLASPYFRAMLQGFWKETTPTDSLLTVDASDWHVEALQIMLDVIHGHGHKVPRHISLDLFAQIAVVVDYYKCHDAVKFFSDTWIADIDRRGTSQEYNRDFVLWLFVTSIFGSSAAIKGLKDRAIQLIDGPFRVLDLPIPSNVVGKPSAHTRTSLLM